MSLVALISKGRLLACSKVTSTNVTFFEVTSLEVTSPEKDVLRGEFFKATSFPGDVLQNEIPEGGHDVGGDVSQSFEVRRIPRFAVRAPAVGGDGGRQHVRRAGGRGPGGLGPPGGGRGPGLAS